MISDPPCSDADALLAPGPSLKFQGLQGRDVINLSAPKMSSAFATASAKYRYRPQQKSVAKGGISEVFFSLHRPNTDEAVFLDLSSCLPSKAIRIPPLAHPPPLAQASQHHSAVEASTFHPMPKSNSQVMAWFKHHEVCVVGNVWTSVGWEH
eukprot:CAMPEP_0174313566 /NCGR_PEP_ID=MMETSP0810-20121108/5065_1 /TAXON_ID=73025 ORGANISM="Eutreptiella gymnastica-like, Strain CCMP1594" /NCGR_SAMPLE_ID=MMETSP0810 /ASSEMBLY_ACC=CAM_ASM_000659 /LENGTH=151 /DNA_ID=CAMNT_0015422381 /DNA_START=304 /DNA_END=760 /DNA_ORIENTATION=-